MIGLVLLAQLAQVTIGDTVWLTTSTRVPNGHILRPQTWDLADLGQVLAPPDVEYRAGVATVRYPVVFWFPGVHRVTLPGPIVVSSAGKSDTLAGAEQVIQVNSVLPKDQPKSTVTPRPAAGLVEQATPSWLPLVVLELTCGVAVVALVAARGRRRRRPAVVPALVPPAAVPVAPVLDSWMEAGEVRTALDGWAHLIAASMGDRPPGARATAEPLLAALNEASFRRDGSPEEISRLVAAARQWVATPP